jgi:putative oxidoreductase
MQGTYATVVLAICTRFAGLPGAGLLIMRLAAGTVLIARGVVGLTGDLALGVPAALIARMGLGPLILAGLWTPVVGVLIAILEIGWMVSRFGDPWIHLFLATLGISLAFLGPGVWSVDSRLFGWHRINIDPHDRRVHR